MPVIHVTMWPISDETAKTICSKFTELMHRETGIPLDKITVLFTEVKPERWSDAGIQGNDPEFLEKSRRTGYAGSQDGRPSPTRI